MSAQQAVAVVAEERVVVRGRAKRLQVLKDTPGSPYAPGPVRAATDAARERMALFCAEHPGFVERLGYEGLMQVAGTYRDEETHARDEEVRAAGVPFRWRREESDDVNVRWSDDS